MGETVGMRRRYSKLTASCKFQQFVILFHCVFERSFFNFLPCISASINDFSYLSCVLKSVDSMLDEERCSRYTTITQFSLPASRLLTSHSPLSSGKISNRLSRILIHGVAPGIESSALQRRGHEMSRCDIDWTTSWMALIQKTYQWFVKKLELH